MSFSDVPLVSPQTAHPAPTAGSHHGTGKNQRVKRLSGFDRVAVVTDGTLLAHGAAAVLGSAATGRTSY